MDRSELSGAILQEMSAAFTQALLAAAPTVLAADLNELEQFLQVVSRQVMGQVVEQIVAARVAALDPVVPVCEQCGAPMRRVDRARPRRLQGLVGDYTLRRPYYVCPTCHGGLAPLDAAVGLDGSTLSPGLSRVACRLGIEGSFATAADQVAETLGVRVSEEAVRRVTERVGTVAEGEHQARIAQAQRGQAIPPDPLGDAPPVLLVAVDGVQAPLVDGWHELKVSRVAPLGPAVQVDRATGRRLLAIGSSSYGAGLEPAEACWWRVYAEACRQGLGSGVRTVVLLGDGAEWIWTHAPRFLALSGVELVEIVDIYHAYEHLWTVGNAVFGLGTPAATAWVAPLKDRLYAEGPAPVVAACAALVPPDAAAAEVVRLTTGYFTTHAARMDYPRFVARQFPIGSGAVESTCKTLIAQRAKQAGMRWSRAGLQAVASLRALHRSGRWAAFWQTQPQCRRPPVGARPGGVPSSVPHAPAPAPARPPVLLADPRLILLPTGATTRRCRCRPRRCRPRPPLAQPRLTPGGVPFIPALAPPDRPAHKSEAHPASASGMPSAQKHAMMTSALPPALAVIPGCTQHPWGWRHQRRGMRSASGWACLGQHT